MAVSLLQSKARASLYRLLQSRINREGIQQRAITMSRQRLEKVMENLQKNPYFEKYAQKIAKLQQTDPEEFIQRAEEQSKKLEQQREKSAQERKQYEAQAKPTLNPTLHNNRAQLDNIMKVEMIQDKTKEEIIEIWKEYHKTKDCVSGVLTPEQFDKIFDRGQKYSTFLLPLPRDNGYEFIVSHFAGHEIHMTSLLWYQTHKENAPECLTLVHYSELRESKGIILMRGEFDTKFLNAQEAQCLVNELQLYYSTDNPHRLKLLQTFTEHPDDFKHMDLIVQLETISLESKPQL